jgi:SAM-dependent methyltransferase
MPAQWIRDRLWERLEALFPPGARVLDVTAGTGLDALHLAQRGVQVVACDLSPRMLEQLRAKDGAIETHVADFNHLEFGNWDSEFDGVISTFAGLNTSPDLHPFAASVARLLRPGGVLFTHLLNRWPLPDVVRLKWRSLLSPRRAVNLGGTLVTHYLYSPLPLYRHVFAGHFKLRRVEAQGLVSTVGQTRLAHWERALASHAPFQSLGTFFSLELIRRR